MIFHFPSTNVHASISINLGTLPSSYSTSMIPTRTTSSGTEAGIGLMSTLLLMRPHQRRRMKFNTLRFLISNDNKVTEAMKEKFINIV